MADLLWTQIKQLLTSRKLLREHISQTHLMTFYGKQKCLLMKVISQKQTVPIDIIY